MQYWEPEWRRIPREAYHRVRDKIHFFSHVFLLATAAMVNALFPTAASFHLIAFDFFISSVAGIYLESRHFNELDAIAQLIPDVEDASVAHRLGVILTLEQILLAPIVSMELCVITGIRRSIASLVFVPAVYDLLVFLRGPRRRFVIDIDGRRTRNRIYPRITKWVNITSVLVMVLVAYINNDKVIFVTALALLWVSLHQKERPTVGRYMKAFGVLLANFYIAVALDDQEEREKRERRALRLATTAQFKI